MAIDRVFNNKISSNKEKIFLEIAANLAKKKL